jgi:hypothetical protein
MLAESKLATALRVFLENATFMAVLGSTATATLCLPGPLGDVAVPSKWWNPVHATIRYVDGRTAELDEPFESHRVQR